MKKSLLLFTLFSVVLLIAACTKEPLVRQGKKDIVGTWVYEKAEVRRIGNDEVNDITSTYDGIRIDFQRGGLLNQSGGFQGHKEGKWYLQADYTYTGSEDGPLIAEGKIILQYKKMEGQEEGKHIEWVDAIVTDSKITCLMYEDNKEYRYTLVKE